MIELKIQYHAVVVDCAKNKLESILADNWVKKYGHDHDR